MKKIESWQTRDGKVFEDEGEAALWEARLDFIDWYKDHELYSIHNTVEGEELADWLEEHREEVLKLLE